MVKSMTGFGAGRRSVAGTQITVELRSVNGRFLKISTKIPNGLAQREAELEDVIKTRVRRGSVALSIFLQSTGTENLVSIDEAVVRAYQETFTRLGLSFDSIPLLPNVVRSNKPDAGEQVSEAIWQATIEALNEALDGMIGMRDTEGAALAKLLRDMGQRIDAWRISVGTRAPHVVLEYQEKLNKRLAQLLAGNGAVLDPAALSREVALFADRSDITEEVERLGGHLHQLYALLDKGGEIGRTLEFLAQEMHREVNTMGSKSADVELSRWVIQMKAELERFKEQIANIE